MGMSGAPLRASGDGTRDGAHGAVAGECATTQRTDAEGDGGRQVVVTRGVES
jgi:hypothetical protein